MARRRTVGLGVLAVSALLGACGGGHRAHPPVAAVPVDPASAALGTPFGLGRLTITVSDAGRAPSEGSRGSPPRRELRVRTQSHSTAVDRAPGLAVVCPGPHPAPGGSLFTDLAPGAHQFVAGQQVDPGRVVEGNVVVALAPTCARPALQVSPGGTTVDGLPRPVLVPLR